MKQPGLATRRSLRQLCPPVTNKFARVFFGPPEFINLLSTRRSFFFTETEYALARDAAIFREYAESRQFFQRESKLESSLRELNSLHRRGIESPIAALGSL